MRISAYFKKRFWTYWLNATIMFRIWRERWIGRAIMGFWIYGIRCARKSLLRGRGRSFRVEIVVNVLIGHSRIHLRNINILSESAKNFDQILLQIFHKFFKMVKKFIILIFWFFKLQSKFWFFNHNLFRKLELNYFFKFQPIFIKNLYFRVKIWLLVTCKWHFPSD